MIPIAFWDVSVGSLSCPISASCDHQPPARSKVQEAMGSHTLNPDFWAAFWCKNGYDSKARPSKSIGFGQPSAVLCSYNSHFTGLVRHERRVGLFCQVRTTSTCILNSPTFTSCLNPPDHLSALGGCPTTSLSLSNSSWSVSCNEEISPAMDITNKNKQEQAAYPML